MFNIVRFVVFTDEFWIFLFGQCSHKGAVAVRQPYIRVVGIEEANEANSRGPAAFTPEEVIHHHTQTCSVDICTISLQCVGECIDVDYR